MYLTKITIDPTKRESALCLSDRGRLHSKIENSFPGQRQRSILRLEKDTGSYVLLHFSYVIPNLQEIQICVGCGKARYL